MTLRHSSQFHFDSSSWSGFKLPSTAAYLTVKLRFDFRILNFVMILSLIFLRVIFRINLAKRQRCAGEDCLWTWSMECWEPGDQSTGVYTIENKTGSYKILCVSRLSIDFMSMVFVINTWSHKQSPSNAAWYLAHLWCCENISQLWASGWIYNRLSTLAVK